MVPAMSATNLLFQRGLTPNAVPFESDWDFLAFADSARMDKLAQHTHLSLPNVDFLVVYDGDHFEEPWGDDPKKKSLSDFKWSKIADMKFPPFITRPAV